MAVSTKPATRKTGHARLWHTPTSKAALAWLIFAAGYTLIFYILYAILLHSTSRVFFGPFYDVIFRCGVMAYIMILGVAAYSLRTRFFHGLPWKAQNWVWAHVWVGIAAMLLALLHADFRYVLHFDCSGLDCVTHADFGMPSLYGLIFLSLGGIVGKLLDRWQTRTIAEDAASNGVGISKAIITRQKDLELRIERFCAGKSAAFKEYCASLLPRIGIISITMPILPLQEQRDFQLVSELLTEHARLAASLAKQTHAYMVCKIWRRIHMILVPLILLVITYHAVAELIGIMQHL